MRAIVLADFGSTYTKVTLVEAGSGRLLATAQAPTTVATDVMEGYEAALEGALATAAHPMEIVDKLAASSAGGGLKLAAIGLEGDYTAAAARQAALNAGAKIELLLSDRLDAAAVAALEAARPEIILFSGGTDGGQRAQVLANAEAAASARVESHVIVACNRDIATEVARLFERHLGNAEVVGNVLPAIRTLDIEPARAAIHEAFIRHVIRGKGLSRTEEFGRAVVMPTPEAVLQATSLLAGGTAVEPGMGDVIVVDIGGATTDVHSAVSLRPTAAGIHNAGIPALPLTRSVQGDLGMRWSATSVLEADRTWLEEQMHGWGLASDALNVACHTRHGDPAFLPDNDEEQRIDRALAVSCITHALKRHCGSLETIYIPKQGTEFLQRGLDLRTIPLVVGTGGMLIHDAEGAGSLTMAFGRQTRQSLTPKDPAVVLDHRYILAAAGLLASKDRRAAYAFLRSEIGADQRSSG